MSGVIMPFVSSEIIAAYGWRSAFTMYGVFTLCVVVPLVLRLVVSRPEDIGLFRDGAPTDTSVAGHVADSVSMRDVARQRNFWAIALTFGLFFCCMSATLTHMVPRLTDMGHSLSSASLIMSLCAGLGVLGKLSFGALLDRLAVRRVLLLILVVQLGGQITMYATDAYWTFAMGAALFGFGVGGAVPTQASVVGRTFGAARFGAVFGLMRPAMFPIQIVGVPLAGWVFDLTGSYDHAFEILFVLYVVAGFSAMTYRAPEG